MPSQPHSAVESQAAEVDPVVHELSLMKQIILERSHPLDLIRELVSNSAAREVGATEIKIKYTMDDGGHIFEVTDNGCGMDFSGDPARPGRLDRFFGLGLSDVIGIKGDEFSWKGLGAKLAYHSRRIEIRTTHTSRRTHEVAINEPWASLERGLKPRPRLSTFDEDAGAKTSTAIRVVGHPPHRQEQPFTQAEIENFLRHRTFIGFTKARENPPTIFLSVFGQTKQIAFGFQELHEVDAKHPPEGTLPVEQTETFTKPGTNEKVTATLRGFITWDAERYSLAEPQQNCGLILSVRGIPYFQLDMEKFGSRSMAISNPGWKKCCLILECDAIQQDMNISRSQLVDSGRVDLLRELTTRIFTRLETSADYLAFRQVPKNRKTVHGADTLQLKKTKLESANQRWIVWKEGAGKMHQLAREPENENDALAILWKLEALGALPFKQFQTLGHAGDGPDLIVHFQEDERSNPDRYTSMEAENRFSNYHAHGHTSSLYPRVICWDLGSSIKKVRVSQTDKPFKYIAEKDGLTIHVFCLKKMPGVQVLTRAELDAAR